MPKVIKKIFQVTWKGSGGEGTRGGGGGLLLTFFFVLMGPWAMPALQHMLKL